jgi:hypothetical protein
MKAGPVELEFERILPEVRAQLPITEPIVTENIESIAEEFAEIARRSPAAAVLGAYARLEKDLQEMLRAAGDEPTEKLTGKRLTHRALERGVISEKTAENLEGLAVLRDLTAREQDDDLSVKQALDYLALTDALQYTMRPGS